MFNRVIRRWLVTLHSPSLGIRSVSPITNHSRSMSLSSLMISSKTPAICLCRTVIFFHKKFLILSRPAPLQFLFFPIARFTSLIVTGFHPLGDFFLADGCHQAFSYFFYPGCIQIILDFDFPKTPPERLNFICIYASGPLPARFAV